jgi:NitT/TauT family transport system ATP-binding protein
VQTRELMQEEVQAIWSRTRQTVLLITHDIDEAIFLSDRVLLFSARPGCVKAQFVVPLERPRVPQIRKSAAFQELRSEIWDLLREEVMKGRGDPSK